jgi:hypothetical protein
VENPKSPQTFYGTYFNKDVVLKLAGLAKIFAWIVAGFYALQWLIQISSFFLQWARGFWAGMWFTDIAQNLLWLLEQPLRGLVYFAVLQGLAQALLMVMDIEENTRRSAQGTRPDGQS